jgi:hypothetical protein
LRSHSKSLGRRRPHHRPSRSVREFALDREAHHEEHQVSAEEATLLTSLRSYPFLKPLSQAILRKLRPNLVERYYRAGECVLRGGEWRARVLSEIGRRRSPSGVGGTPPAASGATRRRRRAYRCPGRVADHRRRHADGSVGEQVLSSRASCSGIERARALRGVERRGRAPTSA